MTGLIQVANGSSPDEIIFPFFVFVIILILIIILFFFLPVGVFGVIKIQLNTFYVRCVIDEIMASVVIKHSRHQQDQ
jgi:hypothetical protein